ncbi:MAG: hypothetical protein V2J25_16385 [Desulfatiglans sp.]|jgi:hypothetical protein|nr:hypothetical protein [Thermodesulfobacteriota bacterium]MEE4354439.1 hypothetical protein [Desulfatiglans sp.]
MKKVLFLSILPVLFSTLLYVHGFCLESNDIVRMKKAGVAEEVIRLMVEEKSAQTAAFTAQEIIDLHQAGLSDETLQVLIREGSFLKDRAPIVYGRDIRSIEFTTAKDIVELKKAGVSDDIVRAIILFGSRGASDADRERAWEMLKNMGIVVDFRH